MVDAVSLAEIARVATGHGPDVMSVDPGLGLLDVAAESGDQAVFDVAHAGLSDALRAHPGDAAHTVSVDPATHRVFFPLSKGPAGTPVLRVMQAAR